MHDFLLCEGHSQCVNRTAHTVCSEHNRRQVVRISRDDTKHLSRFVATLLQIQRNSNCSFANIVVGQLNARVVADLQNRIKVAEVDGLGKIFVCQGHILALFSAHAPASFSVKLRPEWFQDWIMDAISRRAIACALRRRMCETLWFAGEFSAVTACPDWRASVYIAIRACLKSVYRTTNVHTNSNGHAYNTAVCFIVRKQTSHHTTALSVCVIRTRMERVYALHTHQYKIGESVVTTFQLGQLYCKKQRLRLQSEAQDWANSCSWFPSAHPFSFSLQVTSINLFCDFVDYRHSWLEFFDKKNRSKQIQIEGTLVQNGRNESVNIVCRLWVNFLTTGNYKKLLAIEYIFCLKWFFPVIRIIWSQTC